MNARKASLLVLVLLLFINGSTQNIEEEIKRQLEAAGGENELTEENEIESAFRYLQKHPLNINSATADDWRIFPFINELQIKNLERYKALFGKFISIYELQAVPLWNTAMLVKLKPFITVAEGFGEITGKSILSGEHFLRIKETRILERQKGYKGNENGYKGSPDHLLIAYRYRYRKMLDAGFTCEKDAGEPFFTKEIKGFDFFSFHFFTRSKGVIKLLAVGDFTLNLGQGLISWQTSGFGKSGIATAVKRQAEPVLPYTSSMEFNFHRGVVIGLQKKSGEAYFFTSAQKLSATISSDSSETSFSNFFNSGLHRTETEIEKRNALRIYSSGGCIRYKTTSFNIGLNGIMDTYSLSRTAGNEPYNLNGISGKFYSNGSIDYSATPGRIHFFGEAAIDRGNAPAFINGVLMAPGRNLDLALVYRNISYRYHSLYGNAFTENSDPSNESGLYIGMTARPTESLQIDAYADFFSFPWLKYRVNSPSWGKDYLFMLSWKPSRQWDISSRFKTKTKQANTDDDEVIHEVVNNSRLSWKTYFRNNLSSSTELKGCVEMLWFKQKYMGREEGFSGYLEVAGRLNRQISANARIAYFETDGFNSRIYTYESNLPYSAQMPFFDGNGCRFYINMRVSIFKGLDGAARLARTIFYDKSMIGTGLEEISGKKKTEVGIQLQYSF